MSPDEFHSQIQQLIDGEISAEDFKALESELLENPDAMEAYRLYVGVHCGLERQSEIAAITQSPVVPIDRVMALQRRRVARISMLAAAAVVTLAGLVLWRTMAPASPPVMASLQTTPGSVFTVTHAEGVSEPSPSTLHAGSKVTLTHGVAQFALPHRVRALLEAPATLTLVDDRSVHLGNGRGFFEVAFDEGHGFTVETPNQRIVDLGTAFGVDLTDSSGHTLLHLFEGRVRVDDLHGTGGPILTSPRSVRLKKAVIGEEIDGPSSPFARQLPGKIETLLLEDFESGLVAGRDYAVRMDPTAIRDLKGNRFRGIDDDKTWNFSTTSTPAAIHISNPSFEERQIAPKGRHVPLGWTTNSDQFRPRRALGPLNPTEGSWQAWMNSGSFAYQDTGEVIEAGATYTLQVDLGADQIHFPNIETVVIRLYGSDAGFDTPLAEITPNGPKTTMWLTDQTVSFIATPEQATGQTLGIYLGVTSGMQVEWDNVRLMGYRPTDGDGLPDAFELAHTNPPSATSLHPEDDLEHDGLSNIREFQHGTDPRDPDTDADGVDDGAELTAGTDPTTPPVPDLQGDQEEKADDLTPPFLSRLHPADDDVDIMPGGLLTMTFDEAIQFGTGRIFLRNVTDWVETEIAVGGPRTSIDGRVLTITPPADLKEDEVQMGPIGDWECDAWAGIFNPAGSGVRYLAEELEDAGRTRGQLGAMKGPNMLTFGKSFPGSGIRRTFATISPDSRYTVSVALGVRHQSAQPPAAFDGYTIRLTSGGTILAELSENQPPGPPNSVNPVGMTWNSANLPDGVAPGAPLDIEILPNHASGAGYLDVDHVRVTVAEN
ncbi:MAG: FecR domain-containing protein [Haloferula sp.]